VLCILRSLRSLRVLRSSKLPVLHLRSLLTGGRLGPMELFLAPNNPENTILISSNGVAHYQVRTTKTRTFAGVGSRYVTRIQRNADTVEESIVGDIEWNYWGTPTLVRSVLLEDGDVKLKDFLYKRTQFGK
jgi:hypothetical protein